MRDLLKIQLMAIVLIVMHFGSSGIFNFIFFLVLVTFAISCFGAFEIALPSSIVNKIDQKADNSKGIEGIFFMAASLALASFSCIGPIIGLLLCL